MTAIYFRGGDKDGDVLDTSDPLTDVWLAFDGSGGKASPRGRYDRTDETVVIDGVTREVWQAASE